VNRYPAISAADMDEEQKKLAAEYRSGWRGQLMPADGRLGGPLDALIRSPELARRISAMSDYFRTKTSLSQRLNEFAIIVVARDNRSHYEWHVHRAWAEREGVSPEVADQLLVKGKRPSGMKADEAMIYDMLAEFRETSALSDATFEKALKVFSDREILDIVAVSGFYAVVARILALAKVVAPGDNPEPLKDA
jgi:4-carboxymuconolactone decarboxylase